MWSGRNPGRTKRPRCATTRPLIGPVGRRCEHRRVGRFDVAGSAVTAATLPRPTKVPSRSRWLAPGHCVPATPAPPAARGPCTRRSRACWCGSPAGRRCSRRFISCRSSAATWCCQVFTVDVPAEAGPREVRRHRRQHDLGILEIWQRTAVQPARRPAGGPGRPVRWPRPSGTSWRAVASNIMPAFDELIRSVAHAGRGAAQRRHHGQDPGTSDGGKAPGTSAGRCRGGRPTGAEARSPRVW